MHTHPCLPFGERRDPGISQHLSEFWGKVVTRGKEKGRNEYVLRYYAYDRHLNLAVQLSKIEIIMPILWTKQKSIGKRKKYTKEGEHDSIK